MKRRIIFFGDEQNDEFSSAVITPKRIDKSWIYIHGTPWKRFTRFFWYRIAATPLAFFYTKAAHHHRVIGREKLREAKGTGCFLYGNHTQTAADPLIPSMLLFPREVFTVVHPANVSMPILGRITPSLGALPLPDDLAAHKNFLRAVAQRIGEGHAVTIYPEAHIWPYYTKIRPFPDDSFAYPVKCGAPAFCFTNTYQKRRFSKKPKIVTYIDGPFWPDPTLPPREARKKLRDGIYETMCDRAQNSTVQRIRYIRCTETVPPGRKENG